MDERSSIVCWRSAAPPSQKPRGAPARPLPETAGPDPKRGAAVAAGSAAVQGGPPAGGGQQVGGVRPVDAVGALPAADAESHPSDQGPGGAGQRGRRESAEFV